MRAIGDECASICTDQRLITGLTAKLDLFMLPENSVQNRLEVLWDYSRSSSVSVVNCCWVRHEANNYGDPALPHSSTMTLASTSGSSLSFASAHMLLVVIHAAIGHHSPDYTLLGS
jgi:hypothetical protein